MFHRLKAFDALSDPSNLLRLTRDHTAQHDYFVRIKICSEMNEFLTIDPFFIGIFV